MAADRSRASGRLLDVDNLALRETPIPTLDAPSVDEPAGKAGRDDHARRLAALIDRRAGDLAYGVAEGTPHDVRIQKRGEPSKPGEVVPRRFLEVLGGDSLADGAEGAAGCSSPTGSPGPGIR